MRMWPPVDPALLVDDEVTIAIQVKGKLRDTITVAQGHRQGDAGGACARSAPRPLRALEGAAPQEGDRGARPPGQSGHLMRVGSPCADGRAGADAAAACSRSTRGGAKARSRSRLTGVAGRRRSGARRAGWSATRSMTGWRPPASGRTATGWKSMLDDQLDRPRRP